MSPKNLSRVEDTFIQKSGRKSIYPPVEKTAVIEVDNFPVLGKLTALRFIEWVQQNPGGVVALPTGKTPEHFIFWVREYIGKWDRPATRKELENHQIDPGVKPDMNSLSFVQIDEFYPIEPLQHNSFHHYINRFYLREFQLDPNKALLIDAWTTGMPEGKTPADVFSGEFVDLSLRTRYGKTRRERMQKHVIEKVDQYCTGYETTIRKMGGIGFFLGGIGPDGHIGFNVKGSDIYSTTRLTQTNYETQAAAATDLGGIEVARNRLVITIGLATITFNPDAVAIIIAAGEAKATVVKQAIEEPPCNLYPATALQKLDNARFYLTKGAASRLQERSFEDLKKEPHAERITEKVVINLALQKNKRIQDLNKEDFDSERCSAWILKKTNKKPKTLAKQTLSRLVAKLDSGLEAIEGHTFFHTAPHHDDIMLGYWAYILHLVRTPKNKHYFNYMTSGFNAVTNSYARKQLENLQNHIDTPYFAGLLKDGYFDPGNTSARNRDIYQYLDGVAGHSLTMRQEGEARRLLRNLISIFEEKSLEQLKNRISELIMYFSTQYPGKKDLPYIQQLKGMMREWEADLLWGYLGFNSENVNHLRLGFYKGEIFTEQPNMERDVNPVLELMQVIRPGVVTVALDPEGSGPDTHYKVLQIMSRALKEYEKETGNHDIQVWGYRNVWYRFHPSEADILVPVSLNSIAVLENAFDKCFGSQRTASFPSYEMDGPFSRLATRIMVEQYLDMKKALGRQFFNENDHPRLRASHGMCYIKKMQLDDFYTWSQELEKTTVGK